MTFETAEHFIHSPATFALFAFGVALVTDLRTWRKIYDAPNGVAGQVSAGLATFALGMLSLTALFSEYVHSTNARFQPQSGMALVVVIVLGLKFVPLWNALAPRSESKRNRPREPLSS
jgi:hypothetical protein